MADLKRTIDIIFNGVDNTGAGVTSALTNIDRVTGSLQSISGPIADATRSILRFETILGAAGGAVTAYAVKLAGDFDTNFREIATLIDQPSSKLDTFRQSILSYSQDSTQSLDQITQGIYSAISAGVDYTDSLSIVRQSERLAVAGKADLSAALVVLVSSLNAYGDSVDQAKRYSDALFTAVKLGQTTLPELASSLSQVTGIAASGGVSFENLLAAIATLTSTGMPTAQAVTSVRGAITALLKPSSQATDLARKLGIEFNAEALKAKGLHGVLDDVQKATHGNTSQMATLFGRVEALNGVLVLTGKGASKFSENLKRMAAGTGATEKAFLKMVKAMGNQAQKIENAFKVMLIAIGDPLLDEFGNVATALQHIFAAIADGLDKGALKGFVGAIEEVGKELTSILNEIAKNLPEALESADYSEFLNGLKTLREGIEDLFGDVDLTSVEGLRRVIAGVGDAFNTLANFTVGVGSAIKPVIEMLIGAIKWFNGLSSESKQLVGVIGGAATVFNTFAGSITAVATAIIALRAVVGPMVGMVGKSGLVGAVGLATTAIYGLARQIRALNGPSQEWIEQQQKIDAAFDASIRKSENYRHEIDRWLDLMKPAIATAKERAEWADKIGDAFQRAGYAYDTQTGKVAKLADMETTAATATGNHVQVIRDANGQITSYSDGLSGIATQYGEIITKTKKATETSEDFKTKMEAIASNERIKNIQAIFNFKATDAVEQTKRVQAAFNSLNTTISSTGGVLNKTMDAMNSYDKLSWPALRNIRKQADAERKIRDRAADDQHKLIQAQIDRLRSVQQRMGSDKPLISIKADGLAPELEAFMWQILERIQVRATEEYAEFLLGIK